MKTTRFNNAIIVFGIGVFMTFCTQKESADEQANPDKHASAHQQWTVFETSFESAKQYTNPFTDLEVNVVFENRRRGDRLPSTNKLFFSSLIIWGFLLILNRTIYHHPR